MKSREVSFSARAQEDLFEIEAWLEARAGKRRARSYVDRLVDACLKLDLASHRGTSRSDLLLGLRVIGFERRITIAFVVEDTTVSILRVFTTGRDWEAELSDD